ncbi:uncharacterized protein isoform X2 [Musca autumnalis]
MLSLLEENMHKVGKSAFLKNKRKLYQYISERLGDAGYTFTADQVETKFRGMERRYKNTKLNNSLTGRNKLTCPYELELDNILGNKKSINPEFVLDSEEIVEKENKMQEELSDDSDTRSNSKQCLEKKKEKKNVNPKKKALKILEEIAEEKRNYHSAVLNHLKIKEKSNEKRNELLERIAMHVCGSEKNQ